jgi:hypothetical protein
MLSLNPFFFGFSGRFGGLVLPDLRDSLGHRPESAECHVVEVLYDGGEMALVSPSGAESASHRFRSSRDLASHRSNAAMHMQAAPPRLLGPRGGQRRFCTQKSSLSAVGTAASFSVPYLCGFSAQTFSGQPRNTRRYVLVADQAVVKTPLSSTVNWSCSALPL